MSIVLDGTVGIQRTYDGSITNVIWFLYGLPVTDSEPRNAVFLSESFGPGSPQMLSFEYDGEEYVVYADWESASERACAAGVRKFYQSYGYALLSGLALTSNMEPGDDPIQWLTPVQYYDDYLTMSKSLASVA
ncbi:hypothetical protein [Marinobacter sp. ANT_B65]|uniref:hypothetical protein n=1 Tax=Marinobacter sp. ANT_B65 TaxID=2039467 RepID=UPI000BBE1E78|nr:hypothetical protein [Marinobacter sp. ANT_B65]PCM44270.1 hypothetical protein CPA50_12215 [Marinobacter sp. ANT_B65]